MSIYLISTTIGSVCAESCKVSVSGQRCWPLNSSAASLKALEVAGGPQTLELVSPSWPKTPSPLVPADRHAQAAVACVEHPEPCVAGVEVELLLCANMDRSADTQAVLRVMTHGIMTIALLRSQEVEAETAGCTADCTAGCTADCVMGCAISCKV